MEPKRIVITGGPGTGKTVVIEALEKSGHYCFHEIIRSMTLEAKKEWGLDKEGTNPIAFVDDSKSFNAQLLQGRLDQFRKAVERKENIVFYDRGMPDVLAYMDYFEQGYEKDFTQICEQYQYNQVFILPPWKEIYIQDNERLEHYDQAVEIYNHLKKTYTALGYEITEVPFASIADRMHFILNNLQK